MRAKHLLISAVATTLLTGSLVSLAQETPRTDQPGADERPQRQMPMGEQGMHGDMMRMCHQMMMGGHMGRMMMPQLPPGNERLQMQMHAEMMRRMAEVLEKYAGQIRQAEAAPEAPENPAP